MGAALRLNELSQTAAQNPAAIDAARDTASDADNDAIDDFEKQQQARDQTRFRERLELLACEKVNSHFWLSSPGMKQRAATPALLHSPARHGALARARHWCWFFIYRHPFSAGISTPALGALYDRDHTTVLYGIRKIDYSIKHRPDSAEAKLLRAIAGELAPNYGAFLTRRQ